MAVRVAALPPGEDPDSFLLKHGAEAFQGILNQAGSAIEFQIEVLSKRENIRTEIGLKRVETAILQSIGLSPNQLQRDRLLDLAAQRLSIPPPDLKRDFVRTLRPARAPQAEPEAQTQPPGADAPSPPPPEEIALVEHLAAVPALTAMLPQYLPLKLLTSPLCRTFLEILAESHTSNADLLGLLQEKDDEQRRLTEFAARVLSAPLRAGSGEATHAEAIQDLIICVWRRHLRQRRMELERRLMDEKGAENRSVEAEMRRLTQDLNALQRWDTAAPVIELHMML
jgi:DNA primase